MIEHELRLVVYICSSCTRIFNSDVECEKHELTCALKYTLRESRQKEGNHTSTTEEDYPTENGVRQPPVQSSSVSRQSDDMEVLPPKPIPTNELPPKPIPTNDVTSTEPTASQPLPPPVLGYPQVEPNDHILRGVRLRPILRTGKLASNHWNCFSVILSRHNGHPSNANDVYDIASRPHDWGDFANDSYTEKSPFSQRKQIQSLADNMADSIAFGIYSTEAENPHSRFVRVLHKGVITPFSACRQCGHLINVQKSGSWDGLTYHLEGCDTQTSQLRMEAVKRKIGADCGQVDTQSSSSQSKRGKFSLDEPLTDEFVSRGGAEAVGVSGKRKMVKSKQFSHILTKYDGEIVGETDLATRETSPSWWGNMQSDYYSAASVFDVRENVEGIVMQGIEVYPDVRYGVFCLNLKTVAHHFVHVIHKGILTKYYACRQCGKCVAAKGGELSSMRRHLNSGRCKKKYC